MSASCPAPPACDYCGLPINGPSPVGTVGPRYCCFGCRFAAAVASEAGDAGQVRWTLTRLGLGIFFTMNVMVFTMALWSQDVYAAEALTDARAGLLYGLFRSLCLIFAVPVLFLLGVPLAEDVLANLRRRRLTTDVLLLLGVLAAFVYSAVAVWRGHGHVYFEVGCMILVAVTLGRWLEAAGKLKATESLQLLSRLLPEQVRVRRGDQFIQLPLEHLTRGDEVRVPAGERIPADGCVIRNRAAVDEQILTGESAAILKEPGDCVLGGSLNLDGDLLVRVDVPPHEGTLQRLAEMVKAAVSSKGRHQRLADRLAAWFLPLVIAIAIGTFAAHLATGGMHEALMAALAVVLIACPCALALATPLAVWAAVGHAARHQVLFRHGDAISRLAAVRAICFDKTGTLTTGQPIVDRVITEGADELEVLRRALALASSSNHSLSRAMTGYLADRVDWSGPQPGEIRTEPGLGVWARWSDAESPTCLGSPRWMNQHAMQWPASLSELPVAAQTQAQPIVCIGWNGRVRGVFLFQQCWRDGAVSAIGQLHAAGYAVQILTGDHAASCLALAELRGIDVAADQLPEDKLAQVARVRRETGPVAMVGDGINDAPALAAADVGLAMGCGTDVARHSADICLLGDDLRRLVWAIALARKTTSTVRQNLVWAFSYNAIGIALAAFGWLNPILAAVAMVASSLLVVSNSLRLAGETEAADERGGGEEEQVKSSLGEAPSGTLRQATFEPFLGNSISEARGA